MARARVWFGAEKLLSGERFVHVDRVWLRGDVTPYRWSGVLVLTSDRLFFVPDVPNPLIADVAIWLTDVHASGERRNALAVAWSDRRAVFVLRGTAALVLASARRRARKITELAAHARPGAFFEDRGVRAG